MYGYNLLCSSLNELIKIGDENTCIFISCCDSYINEIDMSNTKVKILYCNNF